MSKIAIVIRGHLRTWNFVKHQMFHVMEQRYTDIDWYFSTWETSISPSRLRKLHEDFQGKNYEIYISHPIADYVSSWFGPGTLCEKVAPDLMKNNYDHVIETRPDVYLDIKDDMNFPNIEKNSLYVTGIDFLHSKILHIPETKFQHHFGAQDWFFMFDQEVFHRYSQRRLWPNPQNSHGDIIREAQKNNFNIFTLQNYFTTTLIRPTVFKTGSLYGSTEEWISYSRDEKIALLNEQDIDHEDYITSNPIISL